MIRCDDTDYFTLDDREAIGIPSSFDESPLWRVVHDSWLMIGAAVHDMRSLDAELVPNIRYRNCPSPPISV